MTANPTNAQAETIVVDGRTCFFVRTMRSGKPPCFRISDREPNPRDDDARYLNHAAFWESRDELDDGNEWPTREAAEQFARAHAARQNGQAEGERLGEWQPIESAPKDGTWVALWCADGGVKAGYWAPTYFGQSPSWVTYAHRSEAEEIWPLPTHWQPLPAPPVTNQHKESVNAQ